MSSNVRRRRGGAVSLWSWALTFVGVTCFWLAGKKVWWAWYVGLLAQALWTIYAIASQQWGFLAGVPVYSAVYIKNAVAWTRERRRQRDEEATP